MNQVELGCQIDTTDSSCPLGMRIKLDNNIILDVTHVTSPIDFKYSFDDTDNGHHQIIFEMYGKLDQHTIIDKHGQIVSSPMLTIDNFNFDGIDCNPVFQQKSKYFHNFNGNGNDVEDEFFGNLGCNGQLIFEFQTPLFLWLLENI